MQHRSYFVALAVLALCLSCAEAASPSAASIAGMYVLTAVDGRSLPTPIAMHSGLTRVALADTLWFTEPGLGEQVAVFKYRTNDGVGPVTTKRSAFQFAVEGDRIDLAFVCDDPFNDRPVGCAAPPQMRGRIDRHTIEFDAAFFFQTPLRYQRR